MRSGPHDAIDPKATFGKSHEQNQDSDCERPDYEKLIAEIYFDGDFAGLVSQEDSGIRYEFPPPDKSIGMVCSVDADSLNEALQQAKQELDHGSA